MQDKKKEAKEIEEREQAAKKAKDSKDDQIVQADVENDDIFAQLDDGAGLNDD